LNFIIDCHIRRKKDVPYLAIKYFEKKELFELATLKESRIEPLLILRTDSGLKGKKDFSFSGLIPTPNWANCYFQVWESNTQPILKPYFCQSFFVKPPSLKAAPVWEDR